MDSKRSITKISTITNILKDTEINVSRMDANELNNSPTKPKNDITTHSNIQQLPNIERIVKPVEHIQIENGVENQIENIELTFKNLGKRGCADVPIHILRENLYNSNLICDVSKNNIFENHEGKTDLKNIENKDIFIDDLYIYFPFRKNDCVKMNGCTRLTASAVSTYASVIRNITTTTLNITRYSPAKVLWSVLFQNSTSKIISTISQLQETNKSVLKFIKNNNERDDPYVGYSVAKIGLENVERGECFKNIEKLTNRLNAQGFNIYSLDITRDFSGTFNRGETVKYMLSTGDFQMDGTGGTQTKNTILSDISQTGKHVLTYLTTWGGLTLRVKYYNKWLCQLETATVRTPYGSNISHYVQGNDEHLYETLHDEEVKNRGITRIEISIYGFNPKTTGYLQLIENERQLLNKSKTIYINSLQNQYQNLIRNVKSCVCLAIKDTKTRYLAYWGNDLTGRIVGIKHISRSVEKWEHGTDSFISKFALKNCPIYYIEILNLPKTDQEGKLKIAPLRTFFKNNESKTYLTRTNKVNAIFKDDTINVSELFNPTDTIDWELKFSGKKCKLEDVKKLRHPIYELPTNPEKRISLKSNMERKNHIYDMKEQKLLSIWKYKTDLELSIEKEYILNEYDTFKKLAEEQQIKADELRESLKKSEANVKKSLALVKNHNLQRAICLKDTPQGLYRVNTIAKICKKQIKYYVVLENENMELLTVYGTDWGALSKTRMFVIGETIQAFLTKTKKSLQEMDILVSISELLKFTSGVKNVEYRKIEIEKSEVVELKNTLNFQLKECELLKNELLEDSKGIKKCAIIGKMVEKNPYFLKMEPGEFDIKKIGRYVFRKKNRIVVNVLDTWIWSHNLQIELENIENLNEIQVLKVCIGGIKNNSLNAKDRYISISHI
jgi:hypothetical protein